MTSSFRLNPQWFSKVNQVVEYLISRQIRHIRNVGELSRILSRTSNEISEQMMQSYEERQKVYDRVSENFSQHIRGVDEYYDPVGERRVELPAGYRQAWTNALGEYIVSESEDFNPNVGSNQNWQKMEKKWGNPGSIGIGGYSILQRKAQNGQIESGAVGRNIP
jgi:hypothetical protein